MRKINEKIESMKIKNNFRSLHRYSLQIFPILIVSQNICPKKRYVNVSSDISRLKTGKKTLQKSKKVHVTFYLIVNYSNHKNYKCITMLYKEIKALISIISHSDFYSVQKT